MQSSYFQACLCQYSARSSTFLPAFGRCGRSALSLASFCLFLFLYLQGFPLNELCESVCASTVLCFAPVEVRSLGFSKGCQGGGAVLRFYSCLCLAESSDKGAWGGTRLESLEDVVGNVSITLIFKMLIKLV